MSWQAMATIGPALGPVDELGPVNMQCGSRNRAATIEDVRRPVNEWPAVQRFEYDADLHAALVADDYAERQRMRLRPCPVPGCPDIADHPRWYCPKHARKRTP